MLGAVARASSSLLAGKTIEKVGSETLKVAAAYNVSSKTWILLLVSPRLEKTVLTHHRFCVDEVLSKIWKCYFVLLLIYVRFKTAVPYQQDLYTITY